MDNRRAPDPYAWIAKLYPLVVGGVLVLAGVVILVASVLSERLGWPATAAGGGLVLLGLVASMPKTFYPVLSAVLKKIPWGRAAEANGDLTRALPAIVRDEEEAESDG